MRGHQQRQILLVSRCRPRGGGSGRCTFLRVPQPLTILHYRTSDPHLTPIRQPPVSLSPPPQHGVRVMHHSSTAERLSLTRLHPRRILALLLDSPGRARWGRTRQMGPCCQVLRFVTPLRTFFLFPPMGSGFVHAPPRFRLLITKDCLGHATSICSVAAPRLVEDSISPGCLARLAHRPLLLARVTATRSQESRISRHTDPRDNIRTRQKYRRHGARHEDRHEQPRSRRRS